MPACRDNVSQKQALLIRDYPTEKRILNIAMNLDLFFSAEEAPQQQKMAICEIRMRRALTVAEKLLVGGWPFKEEDLDFSV